MGLDIWIYSGEKPNPDKLPANLHTNDLICTNYHYYEKADMEDKENGLTDLLPIAIEKKITTTYTNWKNLLTDYNIPISATLTGFSNKPEEITIRLHDDNEQKTPYEISLTRKEFENYDYDTLIDVYIVKLVEISYYRNSYELQKHIYDVYNEFTNESITNCGYHHLTKEMIKKLNTINKEFAEEYFSPDDDSLYYHEWY